MIGAAGATFEEVLHQRQSGGLLSAAWRRLTSLGGALLRPRESRRLRVLETVSLGEKRFACLLEVDGESILIGSSPTGVVLLKRLDPTEEHHAEQSEWKAEDLDAAVQIARNLQPAGTAREAIRPRQAASAPQAETNGQSATVLRQYDPLPVPRVAKPRQKTVKKPQDVAPPQAPKARQRAATPHRQAAAQLLPHTADLQHGHAASKRKATPAKPLAEPQQQAAKARKKVAQPQQAVAKTQRRVTTPQQPTTAPLKTEPMPPSPIPLEAQTSAFDIPAPSVASPSVSAPFNLFAFGKGRRAGFHAAGTARVMLGAMLLMPAMARAAPTAALSPAIASADPPGAAMQASGPGTGAPGIGASGASPPAAATTGTKGVKAGATASGKVANSPAPASPPGGPGIALTGLGSSSAPWTIVVLLTFLTLIPSIMICMTPFARLLVVFHFLRQALGLQTTPSNQTLIGLSLILTFFLMEPVGKQIYNESFIPLQNGQITALEAVSRGSEPMRHFMAHYVREKDAALFLEIAHAPRPASMNDVSMRVLLPAYIVSELKAGFQIGAVLFLPFLVVDIVIASITTSVGMMQLPPVVISTPLKLMLFLMVDGWHLLISALVRSFN